MLKMKRILRDYKEAASLNAMLGPWGFIDDRTFITKAGHVGVIYQLAGVDYECLDHAQRRDVVHRFEAALRLLDEHFRVYQYLSKRRIKPLVAARCANRVADAAIQRHVDFLNTRRDALYELDIFLALLYEGAHNGVATSTRLRGSLRGPREALRRWLSTATTIHVLEEEVDSAVARLHERSDDSVLTRASDGRRTREERSIGIGTVRDTTVWARAVGLVSAAIRLSRASRRAIRHR
jgi:hypothetical protein